jgi:MoaA/NifB/PqqE/SkfB family radical SAM enzyme
LPYWAYVTMTRKCNLKCPYCYALDDKAPDLTKEDAVKIVDKLYYLGTRWISFTGGEPTLNKEPLLAGIKQASLKRGIFTQLPSNGHLLNKEYLEELGKAGLDLLDISLDSMLTHQSHKGLQNRNSSLFSNIKEVQKKYGMILKTNFVLNKDNIQETESILDFCHENNILLSLRMVFPSPGGQLVHDTKKSSFFTKEDIPEIKKIVKMIIAKKKQGYALTEPIAYYLIWEKYLQDPLKNDLWQCEGGKYALGIETDGFVRICNSLPPDDGKSKIHYSELTGKYYKELEAFAKETKKSCQSKCLAAAYYCSAYYRQKPFSFIKDNFYAQPFKS